MPNKKYIRGANFERKIKKQFEEKGYYVMRSAGSHGAADLIAIKKNQITLADKKIIPEVILIQCGEDIKEKKDRLEALAKITGCKSYYAVIPEKRKSTGKTERERLKHINFKRRKVGLDAIY